jgi:hypothetical protein
LRIHGSHSKVPVGEADAVQDYAGHLHDLLALKSQKSQPASCGLAFSIRGLLGSRAHTLAAGLLAAAAGFGTLFTVLHVGAVLLAFRGADAANLGAFAHHVHGVLGAAGHKAGGNGADVSAVAVNADTAGHHLHILFTKAGSSTMFAGGDAGVEGVEKALVLSVHEQGGLDG